MKKTDIFDMGFYSGEPSIAIESRVNCLYAIRKGVSDSKMVIKCAPGSKIFTTLPDNGPIRGMHVVGDTLYVVADVNLWAITSSGVCTKLATLPRLPNLVGMADNYIQLLIVDGSGGYVYDLIGTTGLRTIYDQNFPNGARTCTFLSSRFIVEKPTTREFYVSELLDGLSWTVANLPIYATKEQASDLLVAVENLSGMLILWGHNTTEFWQDAGLTPNPFQRITGATQSFGVSAVDSRVQLNGATYFLGSVAQGGLAVYMTGGGTPVRVSTDDVDDYISDMAMTSTVIDAVGLTYRAEGHDIYQLTFPSANRTLLFDSSSLAWSIGQTGLQEGRHFAHVGTNFNASTLFGDSNSPNIYAFSTDLHTEIGQPRIRQVTSKHLRHNGDEFSINEVALIMDTGAVPQSADYHIMLEVSRDGGRIFGSPRNRTIGMVGQYRTPRVKWDRLGSARDFVLRFTLVDPVPFNIAGVEIDVSSST